MKKIQLLFCLLLIPIIVSAQDVWQAKYVEIEQSIKVPNFKNKQYRITKFEALASALAAVNQKAFDTDNGCMADLGCTRRCVKMRTFFFYAQSPDFHKQGLCYYLKILYL